ncbi:MAG: hypothetical protein U0T69_06320 [Chitinophagales bacterium]
MDKEFYTNFDEIESKIKNLKQIGISEDGWTIFYQDENAEKWELNYYESDFKRQGVRILRKSKIISVDELINIVINSNNKDEIIGASIELYFNEYNNKEDFREKLVKKLNELDFRKLTKFDKEKVKIIIYESNLYDPLNRREIVGVSKEKFESDVKNFRENAELAEEILEKIK